MLNIKSTAYALLVLIFSVGMIVVTGIESANAQIQIDIGVGDGAVSELEAYGDEGVPTAEFVGWLLEHKEITTRAPGSEEGTFYALLVNESGEIIGNESFPVRLQEGTHALGELVDGRVVGRLLERSIPGDSFFPGDSYFPGDSFFPGDHFIPGDMFVSNTEEAMEIAHRMAHSSLEELGIEQESYGVLFMALPAGSEFDKAGPGMGLFYGWI